MNLRLLTGVLVLASLIATTAAAQQDPKDQGVADSIYIEITPPVISATSQVVTARLYIFDTPQNVTNISSAFGWDNPKLVADSAVWSPQAISAFNLSRLEWYRNSVDSTNASRLFQCVGLRIFGRGILASTSPKLITTYYFHTPDWTASDGLCISLKTFNKLGFTDSLNIEYVPIWRGTACVGNVITGVLQTNPGVLNFSGVAGGTAPPPQTFQVSEQAGDNIPYTASTATSWLSLTNPTGTTPGDVSVGIIMSGLPAGDHVGQVIVTSAEATNQDTVTVNLHLNPANRPPVLNPIGNRSVDEAQLLQFIVSATDPDGQIPSLSASPLPGTASFVDHHDGTGTFSWTPTYDNSGSYPVTFTASDGSLTDTEDITITVNNVDRPPVLAAIGAKQVLEGVNLNFNLTATDPDLNALTFSAVGLPAGALLSDLHNGTATFSWTPNNTQSGLYEVWFIVSDGSLADSELVNIEVIDADAFQVSPNPMTFTANLGGPNPTPQSFHVSISDGSAVAFAVSTTATWFTLDLPGGTTPADIMVNVNVAGLTPGLHRDSIQVFEAPVGASAAAYDPVWEYVEITINTNMAVNPGSLSWTISEGDLSVPSKTFEVSELGGAAIAYSASTAAPWLSLTDASGMTPGVVTVSINRGAVSTGTYNGTITVTASAINSPQTVNVSLTVTPCPTLVAGTVVFHQSGFEGETVAFDQIVSLSSSGPGEINWTSMLPDGSPYTLIPGSGTTPTDIALHFEKVFPAQGTFADTAIIAAVATDLYSCPSELRIITNVTIYRPKSADTVIVVNTPAVPGMRVGVPVLFTNSCPLTGLGLSLNWGIGMVLDSVSFVGSAIADVTNKTVGINNDMNDVIIMMEVGAQPMIPVGSQQLLATLYFALRPEIEAGTHNIGLGSYPPLTPADVFFYRSCAGDHETEFPEYVMGAVIVGTASNYVCGYVVDPDDNTIEGAGVELWQDYPLTEPLMSTTSSSIGGFAFDNISVIPFDLYAYKAGYYPGKVEDINFGQKGIKIVLQPLPDVVTPTSQWVDYYCPENPEGANMFLGAPVPVGAIVEAYTQNNLLVGQTMVITRGKYGFMPVYRASDEFGDHGARTGDRLHFTINGLDAVATGNTVYPAEYAQVEVCLEVRGTIEKTCTLVEGWNLISWNVNTDNDNIANVLAPIMDYVDVVLGFEQGGLTFDPDLPIFSTLEDVDHLSGFWVKIAGISQVDLTITGLPVVETTPIPLTPGWNLVSYLREESWTVETALASVVDVTLFAYGFPDGQIQVWQPNSQFNQLETFDPCNGYWIKTSAGGWLVYGSVDALPAAPRPEAQNLALSSGVSATTNWVNLYSADLKLDGEIVSAGATVKAYSVEGDHLAGSFTLNTAGRFGFMPVYADIAGDNQIGLKSGAQFYVTVNDVKTSEVFTWTANGDRIEVNALSAANSNNQTLPNSYSLEQNYPNPFNPTTMIGFSMPVTGHARIEIFNVLGASVAVIFDGQAQAGDHQIVWDGRASDGTPTASGVYFYRLTADNYTETRKMMLLK